MIAGPQKELGGPSDHQTPTQEGLEDVKGMSPGEFAKFMYDAGAREAARGLAGGGRSNVASGYIGNKNTENADILNSSAAGTNRDAQGGPVPANQRGGDAFSIAKETHNTSFDTLRPGFGVAAPTGVVPPKNQQILSDLLFSEFSTVAPGSGLGVTNKMFLLENLRDSKIVYREPMSEPRRYDGPTDLVVPPPLEWQNEITRSDRRLLQAQQVGLAATGVLLEARVGEGSLNTLGDDYGSLQRVSDKGLKRYAESPLEPAIITHKPWERVKVLPGLQYARRTARRLFDAQRYPERFESNIAMSGGSTLMRASALAVYPFPVTSQ